MHEIAETRTSTLPHLVLSTAGLPEISDGTQLGVNGTAAEPTVVQIVHGPFRVFLAAKLQSQVKMNHKRQHNGVHTP